jgi:elongation factor P--(R)-beta-lysine ligase
LAESASRGDPPRLPDARRLRQRAAILRAIRGWFDRHGYLEVHTPLRVHAGALEEHLEVIRAAGADLHTSPEMAMKRVLAQGLGRIYQIVPCFRGEEEGSHHRMEFTMLEWYRAGAGTAELMEEVSALYAAAAAAVDAPAPAFVHRSTRDLLPDLGDPDAWFHAWVAEVEPNLPAAVIVSDYPEWQAALARTALGRADRFEVYVNGLELANAFAEELDPEVIRARWTASNERRIAAGRAPHPIDDEFLAAIGHMPRCAGIAMGLDRLVMALTGCTDISEVQVAGVALG